jgi:hypothetical protein
MQRRFAIGVATETTSNYTRSYRSRLLERAKHAKRRFQPE